MTRPRTKEPDDDKDGCELDFTIETTKDDEIEQLLDPKHRNQPQKALNLDVEGDHAV